MPLERVENPFANLLLLDIYNVRVDVSLWPEDQVEIGKPVGLSLDCTRTCDVTHVGLGMGFEGAQPSVRLHSRRVERIKLDLFRKRRALHTVHTRAGRNLEAHVADDGQKGHGVDDPDAKSPLHDRIRQTFKSEPQAFPARREANALKRA